MQHQAARRLQSQVSPQELDHPTAWVPGGLDWTPEAAVESQGLLGNAGVAARIAAAGEPPEPAGEDRAASCVLATAMFGEHLPPVAPREETDGRVGEEAQRSDDMELGADPSPRLDTGAQGAATPPERTEPWSTRPEPEASEPGQDLGALAPPLLGAESDPDPGALLATLQSEAPARLKTHRDQLSASLPVEEEGPESSAAQPASDVALSGPLRAAPLQMESETNPPVGLADGAPQVAPDLGALDGPLAQANEQLAQGLDAGAEGASLDLGVASLGLDQVPPRQRAELGFQPQLSLEAVAMAPPPPELPMRTLAPALGLEVAGVTEEIESAEASMSSESQDLVGAAEGEVGAAETSARAEQGALREAAILEDVEARAAWTGELHAVGEDARVEAAALHGQQRGAIVEEAQRANLGAREELARAERQADALHVEAEAEADSERSGLSGLVGDAATAALDLLAAAVDAIYEGLRAAVKAVFEAASAAAQGLITAAQRAISAMLQLYCALLTGILERALARFPEVSARWCAAIEGIVARAQAAIDAVAEGLRWTVAFVWGGLAQALDGLLELAQQGWAGALGVLRLFVTGDWAALTKGVEGLVGAARAAPPQFEQAAYEELLGADLDQPLSSEELVAAGLAPDTGALPAPPWTPDNVGVDEIVEGFQLSPELLDELDERLGGGDGELEFGFSSDPERSMAAVLGEDAGAAWDDGLAPMQRAEARWGLMKDGLRRWWAEKWPTLLAGGVLGILGFVGLNLLTGGAVMAALPPLLTAFGAVMTGVGALKLAGHLRDYLEKGWAGDAQGGGRSLAKAGAAGAVELAMMATMKLGGAAIQGARGLARGASRAARGAGAAVVRRGKVLLEGIGDARIGRDARSLRELGESLAARTRFKGFKLELQGRWFTLLGKINPWVTVARGRLEEVEAGTPGARFVDDEQWSALAEWGRRDGLSNGGRGVRKLGRRWQIEDEAAEAAASVAQRREARLARRQARAVQQMLDESPLWSDSLLNREAERSMRSVRDEVESLVAEMRRGNLRAGLGWKHVAGPVYEMRGRAGGRVYYRLVDGESGLSGSLCKRPTC